MSPALRPRYWPGHLLALAAVVAALLLGQWQLGAWQAEREAAALDLTRAEPRPLADVIEPDEAFPGQHVGRPVTVQGTWLPDGTVYVSGRTSGDREGYWAATPLAVDGSGGSALVVVRGWAPTPGEAPAPPEGEASFVAWLQPTEGTGEVDEDPTDDVLPQLRIGDLVQHVDRDLYDAYAVVADEDLQVGHDPRNTGVEGLQPTAVEEVPEVGSFTALQNLLYAIEWWIFGLFAVWVWWRWVSDDVLGRRRRADPASAEGAGGVPDPESVGTGR